MGRSVKIPVALATTVLLAAAAAVLWTAEDQPGPAAVPLGWLAVPAALLLSAGLWGWALRPRARGAAAGPQRHREWWSAPVAEVDPLRVGVHRSRDGLPAYVARDCDLELARRLDRAVEHGTLVLAVGPSAAGKTRAAWQAVAARFADRDVYVPDPGADLTRLADAVAARIRESSRRAVVWLDDLDKHLNEGTRLTNSLLERFRRAGAVVVATLRRGAYARLTDPGPAEHAVPGLRLGEEEQGLLREADPVEIARRWSEAELERAQASGDAAVVEAARRQRDGRGHGVGEYLSSAPALYDLWQAQRELSVGEGGHPRAFWVVAACVDLARIGVEHADRDLLEAAHELYDLPAVLRPEPFEQALAWAARVHEGTCGLLLPATADTPPTAWRPFDYLVDRTTTPLPEGLWHLALEHTADPAVHTSIGWAAYDHDLLPIAEAAWRRAATAGNPRAMNSLGLLLAERGEETEAEQWYRKAAQDGDTTAMYNLGVLLQSRGRTAEAEEWQRRAAERGRDEAMYNLGVLLHQRGKTAEAEVWWHRAAAAGNPDAMDALDYLLRQREEAGADESLLRRAAASGDADAMVGLGTLLRQRGRTAEAEEWYRRAAEDGHVGAMRALAGLCEEQGRVVEAVEWWSRAEED